MKTILVSLAHFARMEEVVEVAIQIARRYDGHVIGYYPIPGARIMTYTTPGIDYPLDESIKNLYEDKLPEVKTKFEERMRRSGVKYEWREDSRSEPFLAKAIIEHGREADLIVMGHDSPGSKFAGEEASFIADIIMAAGRPVLVIPPANGRAFSLNKIAIGWNASREACRAAFDSLPLLKMATEVFLVWINPEKKPDKAGKLPGSELATALARHNTVITTKGISNRSRVSKAIVNYAKEDDIDLLVIGAYGHSRLREKILGGVTEHVLKNLPCPVLFSN